MRKKSNFNQYNEPKPHWLDFINFSPEFNRLNKKRIAFRFYYDFWVLSIKFLKAILKKLLFEFDKKGKFSHNELLFVPLTQNHRVVLESLVYSLEFDELTIASKREINFDSHHILINNIEIQTQYIWGILHLLKWLLLYRGHYRKSLLQFSKSVVKGYGYYYYFLNLFEKNNFSKVVLFNDHSSASRAILFAAKKKGVKTYYVPHASISEMFPPLEFDYAFMEGQDMYEKYHSIAMKWNQIDVNHTPKDQIKIVGNVKVNSYLIKASHYQANFVIGVGFNSLDNIDNYISLLLRIINDSYFDKYSILIRAHPFLENKMNFFNQLTSERVKYSFSKDQNSLEFLSSVKFLISGPSNLILESLLLKTPVYPYQSTNNFNDNYGFVKNNITPQPFTSVKDLKQLLKDDYNFNKEMLSSYDASFSRNYSVADEIRKVILNS